MLCKSLFPKIKKLLLEYKWKPLQWDSARFGSWNVQKCFASIISEAVNSSSMLTEQKIKIEINLVRNNWLEQLNNRLIKQFNSSAKLYFCWILVGLNRFNGRNIMAMSCSVFSTGFAEHDTTKELIYLPAHQSARSLTPLEWRRYSRTCMPSFTIDGVIRSFVQGWFI